MTISSTINEVSYTGDGTNNTYPYTFVIFANTDLYVYIDSVLQTLTTDYTVTNVAEPQGGNVVFESGSIPALGTSVVIYRDVPQTQQTDYVGGEKFSPETHERALDRLTTIAQQLQSEVDRCIKLAKTVTDSGGVELNYDATARANQFFGFDADGNLVLAQEFGTWQGDWVTATNYYTGDVIRDGANGANTENIYRSSTVHTSGVWATDLAAGKWILVIDVEAVSDAKDDAEAAAVLAQAWAVNPEDDDVDGYPGEYSALHHAAKAEGWHDVGFSLDPSPDSDHTVSGFNADPLTAGESLVFGDFCYLKPADGKMYKADADDEDKIPCIAMCMETLGVDGTGAFLFRGFARDDSWSWTAGDKLYMSTTAGELQAGPPSGTGDLIQPMGTAITATVIMLNPTYGYAKHK